MADRISQSSMYIAGAARFADLIYLIARDRGLEARGVEHSRFIAFYQGKFAHMGDRNWRSTAICVVKRPIEKMVAVGEDGNVFTYVGGVGSDETISPKPKVVRGVGVVDGYALACGMKREVYRREDEGKWIAMHAPAPGKGVSAGFEAISGFSKSEVYAVGWGGEIWQWDGARWMQRVSPTNMILTGVSCEEDGMVYICGQHGTLIRGRAEIWESIELENVAVDLWDVRRFEEKLYVSAMNALYVAKENRFEPVAFGADRPGTCYKLTEAEGVLWSVGSGDVFSFDGSDWTRVD